MMVCNITL